MKKTFVIAVLGCLLCASVSAQIKTYSSNDCNLDDQVNISDVNSVISEMCGESSGKQMVSADSLCVLLNSINSRLAAIEKKLGINEDQKDTTVTPTPEPTPSDTHEYVDLGLPSGTLWATCNVGANSPEDYGLYFAWGETVGYTSGGHSFDWASYKWFSYSSSTLTKYCSLSDYGTVDNKTELESADDAATVNWGSNWQMPSLNQIMELYNSSYTTTTWTTENGVYGGKISSNSNGNSIFLPAQGYVYNASLSLVGSCGHYWSRTLGSYNLFSAYYLTFGSGGIDSSDTGRCYGQSVRPVRVQK